MDRGDARMDWQPKDLGRRIVGLVGHLSNRSLAGKGDFGAKSARLDRRNYANPTYSRRGRVEFFRLSESTVAAGQLSHLWMDARATAAARAGLVVKAGRLMDKSDRYPLGDLVGRNEPSGRAW